MYPCGFDAADCGVPAYHRLHSETIDRNSTYYHIPRGMNIGGGGGGGAWSVGLQHNKVIQFFILITLYGK